MIGVIHMSFETREANSEEMKKNIKIVKSLTGKMGFDENMGKVNWKLVRIISNFGYSIYGINKYISFTS